MLKCRACLLKTENLVLFDEESVSLFNVLTNLNVTHNDGLPQYLCQMCYDTVNSYAEFRNKCISADAILKSNILQIKCEKLDGRDHKNLVAQQLCFNANISISFEENVKTEPEEFDDRTYEEEYLVDDVKVPIEIIQKDGPKQRGRKKLEVAMQKGKKNIKPTRKSKEKFDSKPPKKSKQPIDIPCGLCLTRFENETSFKDHITKHLEKKLCPVCLLVLNDFWHAVAHRMEHIEESIHRGCYICRKRFLTTNGLEFHLRKVHSDDKNVFFPCNQCGRKYSTPVKLRKHTWESHSNKIYICDHCQRVTHSKQKMKIHMALHNTNKRFSCDKCDFKTNYRSNLTNHVFHKHSDRSGRTLCSKCKNWIVNTAYEKHNCIPRKNYICPVCGVALTSNQFKRHLASHDPVGRYKCDRCPTTYKTKGALQVHTDKHDGIRRYKCEYCPMTFYSQSVIIKHTRTHTGIKPYVCRICSKAFTGNHNLKVHMRVHGEELIVKRTNVDHSNIVLCKK